MKTSEAKRGDVDRRRLFVLDDEEEGEEKERKINSPAMREVKSESRAGVE